ncbi:hypothetical protein [Candidatus Mycoplasma haematominutum]|nr:hypothetical protein [Candidatus Mycoplasma haematominutum]
MKGQSGVLVTFNDEGRELENDKICKGVENELRQNGTDQDRKFEDDLLLGKIRAGDFCNNDEEVERNDQEGVGQEIYFGIYFRDRNSAGRCGDLIKRDMVVIYVKESDKNKYTSAGFHEWKDSGGCGVEKPAREDYSLLVGRREDLMNLWLQSGKK